MKTSILLSAILALGILPSIAFAQAPDGAKEKPKRTLRLLVAGVRPMPVFEQHGDKIVEVDPPPEIIPPTSLELLGGDKPGDGTKAQPNKFSAWPNELAMVPGYKGGAQIRLRLLRPLLAKAPTPPELTCDLAEMLSPLILLNADPGQEGWQKPIATVVDLSAEKLPARSVLLVNLSPIPLKARFEETIVELRGKETKSLKLAAEEPADIRFRIDAVASDSSYPIVNSTYQVPADSRLIVLAIPNPRGAQGAAPVSLKMLVDPVPAAVAP